MDPKLVERLDAMAEKHAALSEELKRDEVLTDPDAIRKISQELSALDKALKQYSEYQKQRANMLEAEQLLDSDDDEIRQLANQELESAQESCTELEDQLKRKLIAHSDGDAHKNTYVEIRVGTGGDESSLFASDLFRMYTRYAEQKGWKYEILSNHGTAVGGLRLAIMRIEGQGAYGALRFESGTHRVQRVPETESQGRIHTSACTVAVLPEAEEMELPDIEKSDLRVDTYRASGAGGQHVNKTDSAVRITHLPTGISVECQQERSQIQNRIRAMALLRTHLLDQLKQQKEQEISAKRKSMVGSGDRSEKIRTYNFPQARITDHRINLTLHQLPSVLDGNMDSLIGALQEKHEQDMLEQAQPN